MRQITLDSEGNFGLSKFLTSTPDDSHYDVFYTKNDNSRPAIDILNEYKALVQQGKTAEAARLLEANMELITGTIITAQEINLMQSAIGSLERYVLQKGSDGQQIIFSSSAPLAANNNDVWIKPNGDGTYAMQRITVSDEGQMTYTPIDLGSGAIEEELRANYLSKADARISYVTKGTTVNGKALEGNITLNAADVGLGNVSNYARVPVTRSVNGHQLTEDINVTAADVGLSNVTNATQMPIAGGTFTGNAIAWEGARAGFSIRNNVVVSAGDNPWNNQVATSCIVFSRG